MKKLLLSLIALLATVGAWAITYPETGTEYIIKNFHGFVNNDSGYKSYMMSNSDGTVLERTNVLTADKLDACTWVFEKVNDENEHTYYLKSKLTGNYIYVADLIKDQNVTLSNENKSIIYLFDGNVADYAGELFLGLKNSNTDDGASLGIHGNGDMDTWQGCGAGNQWILEKASEAALAPSMPNMPKVGKMYRIKGMNSTYPYLGYTIKAEDPDKNALHVKGTEAEAGIYYLEAIAEQTSKGKLVNYQTGLYLCNGSPATLGMSAHEITFVVNYDKEGQYKIQINGGNYIFNNKNDGVLHCGGNDAASEKFFTFEEVETLPVTIGESGYATFYSPVAVTLPAGLEAYYVSSTTSASATMTKIEGKIVPAETAVILKGEAAPYNLTIAGTAETINGNNLYGTVASTYITEDAYVLAKPTIEDVVQEVGLYKAAKNQQNKWLNNGFKAYLPASAVPATARFISFDFGTETAIESVESVENNAVVYDLAGRRVQDAQKGIFIVNGKKVIK